MENLNQRYIWIPNGEKYGGYTDRHAVLSKLNIHDYLKQEQAALAAQPELIPPLVRGEDLIELGIPPGPGLGSLIEAIRDRQLAEEFTSREQALAWAKENTVQ